MATNIRRFFVLLAIATSTACSEPRAPVNEDNWDDVATEQRAVYLSERIEHSLESLDHATDAETWASAAEDAVSSLGAIRAEIARVDPQGYADLESRVEAATEDPPHFARPE